LARRWRNGGSLPVEIAALGLLFVFVALVLRSVVHIVPEYQRLAVFSLGRFEKIAGPGVVLALPPPMQSVVAIDLRESAVEVPRVKVTRGDGASVSVAVRISQRIVDPEAAVLKTANPATALRQAAEDAGAYLQFDDFVFRRAETEEDLRETLNVIAAQWGAEVTKVAIREIG
jgi:regulator of protease activity HflC (stomatin/prohibitin superfamily)